MDKLIAALQALYFLPDQQGVCRQTDITGAAPTAPVELNAAMLANALSGESKLTLATVSPEGQSRCLIIEFRQSADWERVAALYQALQSDLDLPAPAVSISASNGYRLWFSLAQPVALAVAVEFLQAQRGKYLADIAPDNIALVPLAAGDCIELVPALHAANGKWSAFIDPSMGDMFVAEPGLEMAPNMDRQADLLTGCESIAAEDLMRALTALRQPVAEAAPAASPAPPSRQPAEAHQEMQHLGRSFTDPQSFLLAVMNDDSVSARQRIRAAKALLPYFAKQPPH